MPKKIVVHIQVKCNSNIEKRNKNTKSYKMEKQFTRWPLKLHFTFPQKFTNNKRKYFEK